MVQSTCLTSRGSLVRVQYLPLQKSFCLPGRGFFCCPLWTAGPGPTIPNRSAGNSVRRRDKSRFFSPSAVYRRPSHDRKFFFFLALFCPSSFRDPEDHTPVSRRRPTVYRFLPEKYSTVRRYAPPNRYFSPSPVAAADTRPAGRTKEAPACTDNYPCR